MFTRDSVTVVTATTGHRLLGRCMESVQNQTFAALEHFIVADGVEHQARAQQAVAALRGIRKRTYLMPLPYPTGKEGWCGHRVYAGISFLCNTEFICFLDEDNWFEPDHVASLFQEIRATQSQWGFSLRRIFDGEGNFVALDNCESLGNLHPVYLDDAAHLIDTNCYLLRRDVAVIVAPEWYRPVRPPLVPGDRAVTRFLLEHVPRCCSTRRHTVNYTAGSGPNSVPPDFIVQGNRIMRQRYPQGLPWEIRNPKSE